jgi:sugar/nucleoside kinase (ribokinase family)
MGSAPRPNAVFVGLCVLDVVQLVERVPTANEKLTALRQTVGAGGPAANAAMTCAHLGASATLVTSLGGHPLTAGIRADLDRAGVQVVDAAADGAEPPSVSSILLTRATGDRAVVSTNAAGHHVETPAELAGLVGRSPVVLVDGHLPTLAMAALALARRSGATTVLDGGSWKANTVEMLDLIDVAVCSADFHPPGTTTPTEALNHLIDHGVRWAAVTRGPDPVLWRSATGGGSVPVPAVTVVDTLGAGDVFHGAVTRRLATRGELTESAFVEALGFAARTAARACASFGPRAWTAPPGRTP